MRRAVLGVTGSFFVVACGADVGVNEVRQQRSSLTGGDTHDVSLSTALPEAAVGKLQIARTDGNGVCSATVVLRSGAQGGAVLLTAAHCFCKAVGGVINPAKTSATFSRPDGVLLGTSTDIKPFAWDPTEMCAGDGEVEPTDLAVVILDNAIDPAVMPAVPKVYTGGDFLIRMLDSPAGLT